MLTDSKISKQLPQYFSLLPVLLPNPRFGT
ncbi:Uncharacterised protein [Legionella sainthelensi]|nr:Uncharacterised protein [Legionella sainthelensi]